VIQSRRDRIEVVVEQVAVELLTRDRLMVATAAGGAAVRSGSRGPIGTIDLVGTVNNVVSERERLQAIYDAPPAPRKKTLVAPR